MTEAQKVGLTSQLRKGASLAAIAMAAQAAPALAQEGAPVVNDVVVTTANSSVAVSEATHIVNQATGLSISQSSYLGGSLFIENSVGASIDSLSLTTPAAPPQGQPSVYRGGVAIINAGTINGNVLFNGSAVGALPGIYVNDGGTLNGNLSIGAANPNVGLGPSFGATFSSEVFINRSVDGTGVTGLIEPGNGLDFYVGSLSSSGVYTLSDVLPIHFEVGGVEALGAGTTVTLRNQTEGVGVKGAALYGDGAVVNEAIIDTLSFTGTGLAAGADANIARRAVVYGGVVGQLGLVNIPVFNPNGPPSLVGVQYGGALTSFTNEGVINGDLSLRTASFANNGEIHLETRQAGTLIFAAADQDFTFRNTGAISSTNNGARTTSLTEAAIALATAIDSTQLAAVDISNAAGATIEGGLSFAGTATDFIFDNAGTISIAGNPNELDRAVDITVGEFEFALDPALREEVGANSVTLINSGILDGGVEAEANTRLFSFTNTGHINSDPGDPFADAVGLSSNDYSDAEGNEDAVDGEAFAFDNSGTIDGSVYLEAEASAVTVINSGTVERALTPGATIFANGGAGIEIDQETLLNSTLNFTNSGTISTADQAGAAVSIYVEAGDIEDAGEAAANATATVNVVNSGSLITTGGSFITPAAFVGAPGPVLLADFGAALAVDTSAEGQSNVTITNEQDGIISGRGRAWLANPNGAIELVPVEGATPSALTLAANADVVTIINRGAILGGDMVPSFNLPGGGILVPTVEADVDFEDIVGTAIDTFGGADSITNEATGVIEGGIATRSGNDRIVNNGGITGSVDMGSGNDQFHNAAGYFSGSIDMGEGNDVVTVALDGFAANFDGQVDGGAGGDSFIFVVGAAGGSLQDMDASRLSNFEFVALGANGQGTVTSNGEVLMSQIQLATGHITLAEGSTLNAGGANALRGDAATLAQQFTNRGTIIGNVDLGDQNDRFANYGALNGNLALGNGDDSFIQGINATLNGTADGGAGMDTFTLDITGGGTIDVSLYDRLANFEVLGLTGTGTISTGGDGPLPVETIELQENTPVEFDEDAVIETQGEIALTGSTSGDSVTNRGTINGGVDLGAGADNFANNGQINGNVDLGEGGDVLELGPDAMIDGDVDLGEGDDELLLTNAFPISGTATGGAGFDQITGSFGGSDDEPDILDLSGFTQFEQFTQTGGTAKTETDLTFDNIAISGGRLIGAPGSTITGDVNVGGGGTFGSAGTVNGDITVGGTLSPGASPATMTINGDIALGASSVTLFEMTDAVSDAIIINGALTIGQGATLNLTGTRALTPGVAYDLITASDGITGYSGLTINQATGVAGYVALNGNIIQLLGTLQAQTGASPQVTAVTNYLNGLLISGNASAGLIAALPSLQGTGGFVNNAALGRLHPEAYASASQLGLENGLQLSRGMRAARMSRPDGEAGAFVFAQGFGGKTDVSASSASNIAKVNDRNYGVLGGIGFGSGQVSLGAFVGKIDSRQSISQLGAKTDADGLIAGVMAQAHLGQVSLSASAAYDGSSADTERNLANGSTARSHYRLRGWVFDVAASTQLAIGDALSLEPEVAFTHINSRRGSASEAGAGVFDLDVAARRTKASYLSAGLTLRGTRDNPVSPWLSAGIRERISGTASLATASLDGAATGFTVAGARRASTFGTLASGIGVRLAPNVVFYGSANGELGKDGGALGANAGLRVRF